MAEIEIRTSCGVLRGLRAGGAVQYRNVPYAAPPTGALRFAPPRAPLPWVGVRDATVHGPIPPQRPSRLAAAIGDFSRPQGEDCLTLTLTVPEVSGGALPVLVFLHGGAYQACAGSLDWFDGTSLAVRGKMVVVTVNYRLGALGFLAAGSGGGRQGLDDMMAALRWVAREIAAFGGDPDHISVAGQSAGAHAILCMLALPEGRGLFRRAILESPPAGLAPSSDRHAAEVLARVVAAGGKLDGPPESLLAASDAVARAGHVPGMITPLYMPTIDALSEEARFVAAAVAGAVEGGIDILIGTTKDEAHAFFCAPGLPRLDSAAARTAIDRIAPGSVQGPGADPVLRLSALVTEQVFRAPSVDFANAVAAASGRAFTFEFDWAPPGSPLGACHCIEQPFVFGALSAWQDATMLAGADAGAMERLARDMQGAWISFVRDGRPGRAAIPWPDSSEARPAATFTERAPN